MGACAAQAGQAVGAPPAILATVPGAPCAAPRIDGGSKSPLIPAQAGMSGCRQSPGDFFFPPASGKIHMATIMKAAVASTKFPNSGRTGEPPQKARTSATTATAAET